MSLVRKTLERKGLPSNVVDIVMESWRQSTKKQYCTYINRYITFCEGKQYDVLLPFVNQMLEFLNVLYCAGLGYSAINTARSALSSFLSVCSDVKLGAHPLVTRFMKGVFHIRPSLPRYKYIWDVNMLFDYFKCQPLVSSLALADLTLRTVAIVALVSAQRCQSLHLLRLDNMIQYPDNFTFTLRANFKQSRMGQETLQVVLPKFEKDDRLCVYLTLKEYIARTQDIRSTSYLFVRTISPYTQVTCSTISRWIKTVMTMAGIDVAVFKPHSTRSASVSAAARSGLDIKHILCTAGWSNAKTFAKFYNKPLVNMAQDNGFAASLFQAVN